MFLFPSPLSLNQSQWNYTIGAVVNELVYESYRNSARILLQSEISELCPLHTGLRLPYRNSRLYIRAISLIIRNHVVTRL